MSDEDWYTDSSNDYIPAPGVGELTLDLTSFHIPLSPHLSRSELCPLNIVSKIDYDEYHNLLKQGFSGISRIPARFDEIELHDFNFGFPMGFLTALGKQLTELHSFTASDVLLGGESKDSQLDAIEFFKNAQYLTSLELINVYANPGLFATLGDMLQNHSLQTLGIYYSFNSQDIDFPRRLASTEMHRLIAPSMSEISFEFFPKYHGGVAPFPTSSSDAVVEALTGPNAPEWLLGLALTMFCLTIEQLFAILQKHRKIRMLTVAVKIEGTEQNKFGILAALASCPELTNLEIVAYPSYEFQRATSDLKRDTFDVALPNVRDIQLLANEKQHCPKLKRYECNILRNDTFGSVVWEKEGGADNVVASGPPLTERPPNPTQLRAALNGDGTHNYVVFPNGIDISNHAQEEKRNES